MFGNDEFNNAPTGYGRRYLPKGDHIVVVKSTGGIDAKASFKGQASFFAEVILNGVDYSWVQTIPEKEGPQKERSRAIATIKGFLAALIGPEFETANHKELFDAATSSANPFAGFRVAVTVTEKPTKTGGVFSKHDWRWIDPTGGAKVEVTK